MNTPSYGKAFAMSKAQDQETAASTEEPQENFVILRLRAVHGRGRAAGGDQPMTGHKELPPPMFREDFTPGYIDGDPCDTNHPGPHSPEACIHTAYDHDACCYLPQGCLGGCTQPGGCCDPGEKTA